MKKKYEPLKGKIEKDEFGAFCDVKDLKSALEGLMEELDISGTEIRKAFEKWLPDIFCD